MNIVELTIYPIKGCGGVSVDHAEVTAFGLKHDRTLMLIDKEGVFVSQRSHPQMSQITCSLKADNLHLSYKNSQHSINLGTALEQLVNVQVWESTTKAMAYDEHTNKWFSDILQQEVRLVKQVPQHQRIKSFDKSPNETVVSFADGYPYLLLGTASLDLLNQKRNQAVDINRFRANIIVSSEEAHKEDELEDFILGEAVFRNIKPCARCQVITIDQATSIKDKSIMAQLAEYRTIDKKVYFGTNCIALQNGSIKIGDQIKPIA